MKLSKMLWGTVGTILVTFVVMYQAAVGLPRTEPAGALAGDHEKAFWRAIVKNDFNPPANSSVEALAHELSGYLGSDDPELRDDLAYSILTNWIYQKKLLDADAVRKLQAEWISNLSDIPGSGKNAVLRRSFSALMLSITAARDNAAPFLTEAQYRKLLDAALAYLAAETDLRGYDDSVGWVHSAAHTADLLKFLARSRYFNASDQARFLSALQAKMKDSPVVFTHGEDERMARTILSVVNRADFDAESFKAWAAKMKPAFPDEQHINDKALAGYQNSKNLMAKLEVILSSQKETASIKVADDAVKHSLENAF